MEKNPLNLAYFKHIYIYFQLLKYPFLFRQGLSLNLPVFHHLVQILFHELKHKKQLVIFTNNFLQPHNVGMVEFP